MSALTGLIGIFALLGLAFVFSSNRRAINWRLVISGMSLQLLLAIFCLKVPLGRQLFQAIGEGVEKLLSFSDAGASFIFGALVSQPDRMNEIFGPGGAFIFAFKLVPTIIFVAVLVGIAYHIGLMQRVVKIIAWAVYRIMGVSGAEALSNSASIFVGQVEAQLLVKPYVPGMTRSELLAVMAGSMACIAGGIMAVYIQMGVPAVYLLTASVMAIPGALVISKMMVPETEPSQTQGEVKLEVEKQSVNIIHAAAMGASEGLKIGLNVCAMLVGFIALITAVDFAVGQLGLALDAVGIDLSFVGLNLKTLSMNQILGTVFSVVAVGLGVPTQDAHFVGGLMGTKMVVNEFVAYAALTPKIEALDPKSVAIASFALCGFANFSSIAMQIGGIGEMAPARKRDLAELGVRALLCGTMASYVSAAWAGILLTLPGAAANEADVTATLLTGAVMLMLVGIIVLANRFLKSPALQPATIPVASPVPTAEEIAAAAALVSEEQEASII